APTPIGPVPGPGIAAVDHGDSGEEVLLSAAVAAAALTPEKHNALPVAGREGGHRRVLACRRAVGGVQLAPVRPIPAPGIAELIVSGGAAEEDDALADRVPGHGRAPAGERPQHRKLRPALAIPAPGGALQAGRVARVHETR